MTQAQGFFDFVGRLDHYKTVDVPVPRLNKRHRFLIEPYRDEIAGARVFDLASHDGRWCYAFAGAGAAKVVGVEARSNLIAQYASYPETDFKSRVELRCGDLFEALEAEVAAGETYDIVSVFGILYHIMDHFRLFQLIRKLKPRLIIVDSEFMLREAPMISLGRERTDNILNAAPQVEGQEIAVKGVPSFAAMELMADVLGYRTIWSEWKDLPAGERLGVNDYYREANMRRATCVLRPR